MNESDISFSFEQIVLLREYYCPPCLVTNLRKKKVLRVVHLCAGFVSLSPQIPKWHNI